MQVYELTHAAGEALLWCRAMVIDHHYRHSAPDPRSRPVAYLALLGGERIGCLWFSRPESTACYRGGLTFGSQADVASDRAVFDRWEVLNLCRVWLVPDVQPGGRLHSSVHLPGFIDRHGLFRSTLASTLIRLALSRVGYEYLLVHPPVFVAEPYVIRALLSYCDRAVHRGAVYKAAGFQLARVNAKGIETWWTPAVAGLTAEQDRHVRTVAAADPRGERMRHNRVSLFSEVLT